MKKILLVCAFLVGTMHTVYAQNSANGPAVNTVSAAPNGPSANAPPLVVPPLTIPPVVVPPINCPPIVTPPVALPPDNNHGYGRGKNCDKDEYRQKFGMGYPKQPWNISRGGRR